MMLCVTMYHFFKLSRDERRLFIEALCETLLVRTVTSIRCTRRYASWLGQERTETEVLEPGMEQKEQVLQIKAAISRSRRLFWARKCLVEAIAAKRMLDRRNIPATLYMGVAKDGKGKMIAHAWLRSGNIWVSGGGHRHGFTVVGVFS